MEENQTEEVDDLEINLDDPYDTTDWKAKSEELQQKAIGQRERTKALKQEKADLEAKLAEFEGSREVKSSIGELDETQLDYLDLKGISESEDIKVIEDIVNKTGKTVREVLKDEYVISKLESNKQSRDVTKAIPSATKRGGNQTTDIDTAIAKFEKTGELPDNFELRTKVVNSVVDKGGSNRPSWQN